MTEQPPHQAGPASADDHAPDGGGVGVGQILTVLLWLAAGNVALAWVFTRDGGNLSDRSNSMHAIMAVGGVLFSVVALAVEDGAATRASVAKALTIILLSVIAFFSVQWDELGWGTLGLLVVVSIPALVRLTAIRENTGRD